MRRYKVHCLPVCSLNEIIITVVTELALVFRGIAKTPLDVFRFDADFIGVGQIAFFAGECL